MRASDAAGRRMALAVGLSLLAHAIAFLMPVRERAGGGSLPGIAASVPLTVRLALPEMPDPAPAAAKPPAAVAPRRASTLPYREPVIARSNPSPEPVPFQVPVPAPVPAPQFDMAALIQRNRARRRAAEAAMQRDQGRDATPEELAVANLNRNLESISRSDGTGGVFQITRIGGQTAEFAFNGWTRERRGQWREYIEVEIGPDGDLERAVVRRMIALIREHYSADFRWESSRLGRVLVLSAAPADNEGLEDFLLREFFGTPLVKRGR